MKIQHWLQKIIEHRKTQQIFKEISANSLRNAPKLRLSRSQNNKAFKLAKENLLKASQRKTVAKIDKRITNSKPPIHDQFINREKERSLYSNSITNSNINKYTSLGSLSNYGSKRSHNTFLGKSLTTSKTLCNLLSFDLPTILDTSLDEESLSPVNDNRASTLTGNMLKLDTGRASVGVSQEFKNIKKNYMDKRKNKLSVDLRSTEFGKLTAKKLSKPMMTFRATKRKSKVETDENARKHLVRSHLNEIYGKVMMMVKSREKGKRHSVIILKSKPK